MDPRELARQAMNGQINLLGAFVELTRAADLLEEHGIDVTQVREDIFVLTQEIGTILPKPDVPLKSIEELVDYLWEDEVKSFQEEEGMVNTDRWADNGFLQALAMEAVDKPGDCHILCHIARIKLWLP